jgi:hypothetical protein
LGAVRLTIQSRYFYIIASVMDLGWILERLVLHSLSFPHAEFRNRGTMFHSVEKDDPVATALCPIYSGAVKFLARGNHVTCATLWTKLSIEQYNRGCSSTDKSFGRIKYTWVLRGISACISSKSSCLRILVRDALESLTPVLDFIVRQNLACAKRE